MKYYWILDESECSWEYKFKIIPQTDKRSYNDVKEFALWCAATFKSNYILTGCQHEILSGGCGNNAQDPWRPHDFGPMFEYTLSCSATDAMMVKLTWEERKNEV